LRGGKKPFGGPSTLDECRFLLAVEKQTDKRNGGKREWEKRIVRRSILHEEVRLQNDRIKCGKRERLEKGKEEVENWKGRMAGGLSKKGFRDPGCGAGSSPK